MTDNKSLFLIDVVAPKVSEIINGWKSSLVGSKTWTDWFSTFRTFFDAVDQLINYVEDLIEKGGDKKAAVLKGSALLFDKMIYPFLPIWIKPFNSLIKSIIIDAIISSFVDFLVSKYNQTIWAGEVPVPAVIDAAPTEVVIVNMVDYKKEIIHKCNEDCDCK